MKKTYKIGTVETLRVNKTGRRFYLNLDAFTVQAYGIETGDLLKVELKEGMRPGAKEEIKEEVTA
jgi:hypothetical protein